MTDDNILLNLLPLLAKTHLEENFNLFKVMHHGTVEKQISNIFAWLLNADQTHKLGDAFVRLFIGEINNNLDEPIKMGEFAVLQEVNTSGLETQKDIADIVLEGEETVIAIENYHSSSGHGHNYYGYYDYGIRNSKRSIVVLLCEVFDNSLQTDGWENATVVTYSNLVRGLYRLVQNDINYQQEFPLQYGFIIQMEDYFVKSRKTNDNNSIDFIKVLLASGEGERFRKYDAEKTANDLGEFLKEEAIHYFNESREMLSCAKGELKRFANTTLKGQLNTNTNIIDEVSSEYQGIYQWTINFKRESEILMQIKFGPSAWYANEKDDFWKLKVTNPDYSHIFVLNSQTKEIRQSAVKLGEVLDRLASDDTRLYEELIALISD